MQVANTKALYIKYTDLLETDRNFQYVTDGFLSCLKQHAMDFIQV